MSRLKNAVFIILALGLGVICAGLVLRFWIGETALAEGRAAQARGDLLGGAAHYRTALSCGSGEAAIALARLAFWRGDWAAAESLIREASRLVPVRGSIRILEAKIIGAQPGAWNPEREERVLDAVRRAVALNPGDPFVWLEYADVALTLVLMGRATRNGSGEEAVLSETVQAYREALRRDPGIARAVIARILDRSGDPHLPVAITAGTEDPELLRIVVEALADRGLWEKAEADYWDAAEAGGALRAFSLAAAGTLSGKRLPAAAFEAARRGLLESPDDPELLRIAAAATARLAERKPVPPPAMPGGR